MVSNLTLLYLHHRAFATVNVVFVIFRGLNFGLESALNIKSMSHIIDRGK
jgi:hypothetical protein